jgi:hypothetical protein
MSSLAWVRWWTAPWAFCHNDWKIVDKYFELRERHRNYPIVGVGNLYGITPCLPVKPQPTLLKLALASTDQLELALALIDSTCRRTLMSILDESQNQWASRLSKVLPPDMLRHDDDPLQLLRIWVSSETWQRIRLRFPRQRVLDLEKKTFSLGDSFNRLDTLWQAVVWRIAPFNSDGNAPESKEPGD